MVRVQSDHGKSSVTVHTLQYPKQMFLKCFLRVGGVPINPMIIEKINALEAPDVVKDVLHDILKIEDRVQVDNDQRNAPTYMGKILAKHANCDEVVKFCEKW